MDNVKQYDLTLKKDGAEWNNMRNSIIDDFKAKGYTKRADIAKAAKEQLDELLKPCKVKKGGAKEIIPLMKSYAEIYKSIIEEFSKRESKEELQARLDKEDMQRAIDLKKKRK